MTKKTHESPSHEASLSPLSKLILPTILIFAVVVVLYMAKGTPVSGLITPHHDLMEKIVGYAILGCELASVVVIVTASVSGLVSYLIRFFKRNAVDQIWSSGSIRLRLGHRLSLALEFAMAADILGLAISPNFSELLTLFIIVLLRVLITVFLEYDIESTAHFQAAVSQPPARSEVDLNKED